MELTERERERLAEIEERLSADDPRLQRALSGLSTRPMRGARARALARTLARSGCTRLVLSITVLVGGVAMLLVGVVDAVLPAALLGAVMAQFGPWLLARSSPARPPRPAGRAAAGRS